MSNSLPVLRIRPSREGVVEQKLSKLVYSYCDWIQGVHVGIGYMKLLFQDSAATDSSALVKKDAER